MKRFIFHIDVGNLPKAKADEHVKAVLESFMIPDSSGRTWLHPNEIMIGVASRDGAGSFVEEFDLP